MGDLILPSRLSQIQIKENLKNEKYQFSKIEYKRYQHI